MSDIKLMTMKDAAERLGLCVKTLRFHVRQGDIKYILIGKRTRRFTQGDLDGFIENRKRQDIPSPSPRRRRAASRDAYDFSERLRKHRAEKARPKK